MREFVKILLSLSVSGTLLLLLIFGLKQLYRNHFSRRWQYYIWLIAALRFLFPFTPDTTIVGSMFEMLPAAAVTSGLPTSPDAPVSLTVDSSGTQPISPDKDSATEPLPQDRNRTAARRPSIPISACLFFLWAAPALVLFVRKITLYQSFIRYVRAGNTPVSDIKILNLLSDCKEKLYPKTKTHLTESSFRTRPKVELCHNAFVPSPMMIGFFRPRIILPAEKPEDKDLSYVFLHELIHYKQKDMFYKWLIQMVVCIHWFNPFVYLLEKEVNQSCELSCDETLLSMLDEKARREYGDMLISFMRSNMKSHNQYKNSFSSVTLTEGAAQLKERLGAIMNFKKKSKTVTVVTTICTIAICVLFLASGAYAAPSADHNTAVWNDREIMNDVLSEDGVYYIFCDGAGEDDKPQSSVSDGYVQFVLVRKDSYTSIGPFRNSSTLQYEVRKQCDHMSEQGLLTAEEETIVLDTAKQAADSRGAYTYVQRRYYSDSYIIQMGWNLDEIMRRQYTNSKEITLADHTTITVYFGDLFFGDTDGNAADYMSDSNAVSAVGKLIDSLKTIDIPNYPAIEVPLVTHITYVGENLPALAEEYFESSDITGFSAVFTVLDPQLQQEYCQKIYDRDQIALFAAIIPYMDRDRIMLYAEQADHDMKTDFFSVLLRYMQPDDLNQYAAKYYADDQIARFAVIVPYMTETQRQEWLIKATADHKSAFSAYLSHYGTLIIPQQTAGD